KPWGGDRDEGPPRSRHYGERATYEHVVKGVNCRLDGLQAALLGVKLPRLAGWNEARSRNADAYMTQLAGVGDLAWQQRSSSSTHVYHLFVIETQDADEVRTFLMDRRIQTVMHYAV